MKIKAIRVTLEGYLYLKKQSCIQRGFEFTERYKKDLKDEFGQYSYKGMKEICSGDIGGGCGSKNPNTWTSWSVEQITKMLKEKNLPFEFTEVERIPLNLF